MLQIEKGKLHRVRNLWGRECQIWSRGILKGMQSLLRVAQVWWDETAEIEFPTFVCWKMKAEFPWDRETFHFYGCLAILRTVARWWRQYFYPSLSVQNLSQHCSQFPHQGVQFEHLEFRLINQPCLLFILWSFPWTWKIWERKLKSIKCKLHEFWFEKDEGRIHGGNPRQLQICVGSEREQISVNDIKLASKAIQHYFGREIKWNL